MDDLLCAAMVKYYYPAVKVVRTNRVPETLEPGTIVCDVGGVYDPERNMFDHHNECPAFEDGTKHAAIGLFLMNYPDIHIPGALMSDIVTAERIDNGDLSKIEGYHPLNIARVSNPNWDSDKSSDDCFFEALEILLENYVKPMMKGSDPNHEVLKAYYDEKESESERSFKAAEEVVMAAYNKSADKRIVELPVFAPWQQYLVNTEAVFVIYPSLRGGANLQCVPAEAGSFKSKKLLPNWRETSAPEGMTFCHPACFLASFETVDQAIRAAKEVM